MKQKRILKTTKSKTWFSGLAYYDVDKNSTQYQLFINLRAVRVHCYSMSNTVKAHTYHASDKCVAFVFGNTRLSIRIGIYFNIFFKKIGKTYVLYWKSIK